MSFSWSTFVLQAVNFLVLVWLLQRFLFKPIAAIVARRKEEIARAQAEAAAAKQRAEVTRREFETRQARLEAERQSSIDELRAELADERAKMIQAAREDIEKLKAATLKRLDEERDDAAREVFDQSVQIAVRLAERMLLQLAGPRVDDLFLDRVLDHFDHLSATQRAALFGDTRHDGAQLIVATAYPLNGDAEAKWRSALSERFGTQSQIEFTIEQGLIAGAELKFPHAILRFSWRDCLADAQRELNSHEQVG
jgi:F-type H+-transporting ATPase subunit b